MHEFWCASHVGPTCDCGNQEPSAPVLLKMKLTFLVGYPYTFFAEHRAGEMFYKIAEHKPGTQEQKWEIEVSADTFDRLLRAQQVEHLSVIAGALDADHAATTGRVRSITHCLNQIAGNIDTDEVVFPPKKPEQEEEPS